MLHSHGIRQMGDGRQKTAMGQNEKQTSGQTEWHNSKTCDNMLLGSW